MAYRSLYRKWRPLKFGDVVGQDHITRTLKNALMRENVSHAYLFCGPRGTGKTTVAKLLARAVNCTGPESSEPCGECKQCGHILSGASMDVFELDAASNRGIDEVRDLREKTRYAASEGKHKVYIIDEAHMLTNEAFNALLKTLEEPPSGVIFILATTEPSKLPPTVISRCQRLDFRLLTAAEVKERIKHVACEEGWGFEEEALLLIARLSEGALRDALGLMEQVYAFGEGGITADNVYMLAGLAREETVGRLVEALAENDVPAGLNAVQEVTFGGKDLHLFIKEQMFFFKQLLVIQAAGAEAAEEQRYRDYFIKYKDNFSRGALLEIISLLHRAAGDVRLAEHAHFILEITFLNMLRAVHYNNLPAPEAVAVRKEKPEQKTAGRITDEPDSVEYAVDDINRKNTNNKPVEKMPDSPVTGTGPADAGEEPSSHPLSAVSRDDADESSPEGAVDSSLNGIWSRVLDFFQKNKRQASTHALLQMLCPESLEGKYLNLSYDKKYSFLKDKISEVSRRKLIEKAVSEAAGRDILIRLTVRDKAENKGEDLKEENIYNNKEVDSKENGTGRREHTQQPPPDQKPVEKEPVPQPEKEKRDVLQYGSNSNVIFEEAVKLFEGKIIENDN